MDLFEGVIAPYFSHDRMKHSKTWWKSFIFMIFELGKLSAFSIILTFSIPFLYQSCIVFL